MYAESTIDPINQSTDFAGQAYPRWGSSGEATTGKP
jgi:hypothetical protein